jgi:hypothetical protein
MIFKIQKICLRLIKRVNNRVSCRGLFSDFGILTITSLYIFQTLCFLKKNKIYTTLYSDVHSYNTVHKGKPLGVSPYWIMIGWYAVTTLAVTSNRSTVRRNTIPQILQEYSSLYLELYRPDIYVRIFSTTFTWLSYIKTCFNAYLSFHILAQEVTYLD